MSMVLLRNIYKLITKPGNEPLSGHDLLIEESKIKAIGVNLSCPDDNECRIIDCSTLVVMPGLVNTHHHFYQTLTRNIPAVQNAKLFDWLTYLYEIWKNIDSHAVYYSSLLAMGELLKTGCTATTDHHYLYPSDFDGDIMELQFSAADQLGMRFSPTRGSMSLGRKDGGLPPDSVVQDDNVILDNSLEVIEKYHDPSPDAMHKIILAPCSPFSVSKDLMRETARMARAKGVRLQTHLAETVDENGYCMEKYGKRPLVLMEECEFIGEDVSFVHGVHFNDEELQVLADSGSYIVHCPSSNMRLGSGICRVHEMMSLGMNIAMGVDGSASNDTSDMLGEARNALLLQRVAYGSDAVSADDIFRFASLNGSRLMGFTDCGLLETGRPADMALFDVSSFEYAGSHSDPYAALLFTGFNHGTKYTIVHGEIVVDNNRLTGVDEEKLAENGNKAARRLLEMAGLVRS